MILTISGPPGSGKDTVAKIILDKLPNYSLTSMGNLRREAAEKRGMSLEEFNAWGEKNPIKSDKEFDDFQKEYGENNDNFIMVARLGWYFIPHSFKVYVDVEEMEGAKRIYEEKQSANSRNEVPADSIEHQRELNSKRVKSDLVRYGELYSIDPYNKENYDFIVDSTGKTAEEVAEEILKASNIFK